MNVLIEGVGQPAWGALLPYIRSAARTVVGTESRADAFGLYVVDRGYVVPEPHDPVYFKRMLAICRRENIDLVVPARDAGLYEWAKRKERLARQGIDVLVSPPRTIAVCLDKWKTYQFFRRHDVPTPRTSLRHEYELIKPRQGEGGQGILRARPGERIDMSGRISQELVTGEELSIDALCDPRGDVIYVVPRLRLRVESGQSVLGKVVRDDQVRRYMRRIFAATRFCGPVNVQCFRTAGGIVFTEINPRISGGLSLSMAATENWFAVIARGRTGVSTRPKRVNYGLMMMRHLADCIVHERDLIGVTRGVARTTK